MTTIASNPHVLSVTEAASRGVPSLVRSAEHGEDIVVERHGKAIAALVSMAHLDELKMLEDDLRDSVLLLARLATDSGARTELDDVLEMFDLDRAELEAELKAEQASGRE